MPAPISFTRPTARRESHSGYPSYSNGSYLATSLGGFNPCSDDLMGSDDLDGFSTRLETDFCKDFSCCGLVLNDLHHLLQHYEDVHIKTEDDMLTTQNTTHLQELPSNRPKYDLDSMKRKAYLDMQYHLNKSESKYSAFDEDEAAFDFYSPSHELPSRKRSWRPSMSSPSVVTRDFFSPSQSARSTPLSSIPTTPTQAISHDFHGEAENQLLFGPPADSDDWVRADNISAVQQQMIKKPRTLSIAQEYNMHKENKPISPPQVIEHPGSNLVVVEKPYRCSVPGCDKAYKNQNGLKYHKVHGNCAANPIAAAQAQASGQAVTYVVQENKPHSCPLCAKRYKNLNGLKYHNTHSHQHVTTESNLKAIQEAGNISQAVTNFW